MDYKAYMRRKLLEGIYDKLSEDDKRLFVLMSMDNKSDDEILSALRSQHKQLEEIRKSQSFVTDFGANIAGNALWDGLVFLGKKLFRL